MEAPQEVLAVMQILEVLSQDIMRTPGVLRAQKVMKVMTQGVMKIMTRGLTNKQVLYY